MEKQPSAHLPAPKLYTQRLQEQGYGCLERSRQLCSDMDDFYETVGNIMDKLHAACANAINGGLKIENLSTLDWGFAVKSHKMLRALTENKALLTQLDSPGPQQAILAEKALTQNLHTIPHTIQEIEAFMGLLKCSVTLASKYDTLGLPVRERARADWMKAADSAVKGLQFEINSLKGSRDLAGDTFPGSALRAR